jgi:polygalacturonase
LIVKSVARVLHAAVAGLVMGVPVASFADAPPSHGAAVWSVTDFGAVGDGKTLNTAAFARTVAACSSAGGGTVLVPPGRYLTGAIELKSHMRFSVEPGATLLASEDAADYPMVEYVWDTHQRCISSLLYAHDAEDVTVTGRGTIDGQGFRWWAPILAHKGKKAKKREPGPGADADAPSPTTGPVVVDNAATSPELPYGRPQLIRLLRCRDVVIEGLSLLNSPEWNVHPVFCRDVRVDGLTITAHVPSPNTDGINPESCRGVQIVNCRIDNGDDCITLKSGIDEAGRRLATPDEDIRIANCVTYHGHGGVTIGSEMSGGVHNVVVTNCVFHGTDNGIRIKSQRGRGGVVEDVTYSNLVMDGVPHPFTITSFYSGKDKPDQVFPVTVGTPTIRDINISNVLVRGAATAGSITGLQEMPIENVTFSNVQVQADKGFTCTNAQGVRFLDCRFDVKLGPAMTTVRSTDIDVGRLGASTRPSTGP